MHGMQFAAVVIVFTFLLWYTDVIAEGEIFMNTNDQILQVEGLTKVYGKGDNKTDALRGITFNVQKGEFLGIMGASGSGKTTLLNCIATMLKPTSGKIILHGRDISKFCGKELADYHGREIGYLFQEFELLDNLPCYTVLADC